MACLQFKNVKTDLKEDKAFDLNILKSKPHFEILNDLRGLASVVEVVFHFMEIVMVDFSDNFILHGYLAVVFSFVYPVFWRLMPMIVE